MKKRFALLIFIVFAIVRADCSSEMPEAFTQILRNYEKAWIAKDAAALAELFVDDGYVLPNKRNPVQGRKNIRKYYEGHGGELYLSILHYAAEGNIGFIIGNYSLSETGPKIGKFTLTLRKNSEGKWLIVSDMDNPNQE